MVLICGLLFILSYSISIFHSHAHKGLHNDNNGIDFQKDMQNVYKCNTIVRMETGFLAGEMNYECQGKFRKFRKFL